MKIKVVITIILQIINSQIVLGSWTQGPSADNGSDIGGRKKLTKVSQNQKFDISTLNLVKIHKNNSITQSSTSPISITLDDFDEISSPGNSRLSFTNNESSFMMNIGSANNTTQQVWVLPENLLNYFDGVNRSDFIHPSEVPTPLRLNEANKVIRSNLFDENNRVMDVYNHYILDNSGVFNIGISYDLVIGDDDVFDESDFEVVDVPLNLNDNFSGVLEETNYRTNQKTYKETYSINVDAFGTISTPTGTYECLRMFATVQTFTRPNETSNYVLASSDNYVIFLSKSGEYFLGTVSGSNGNVNISDFEYSTIVPTSLLSNDNSVKLNNDTKGVTINVDNDTAHPSAILDVKSDNQGILIPRIAKANRPANPATGLLIFQIDDTPGFYYFDGTNWLRLATN